MYFIVFAILTLILIIVLVMLRLAKHFRLQQSQAKKKRAYQKKHELKDGEFTIFEGVMRETKSQIFLLEKETRALENPLNLEETLRCSKAIFQALMAEPKSLIQHGDFLYKSLPSLTDAVKALREIEENKLESQNIGEAKNEIVADINRLSKAILSDYESWIESQKEKVEITTHAAEIEGFKA